MTRRDQDFAVGQDSFLDTTANLVGILIILVVVVGTKARIDAVEHTKKKVIAEVGDVEPFADEARAQSRALHGSLMKQQRQLAQYEVEKKYRERERNMLMRQVAFARESLQEELETADQSKQELVRQAQELADLEAVVSQVEKQVGVAEEMERPKVVLEHLPTPMAKTVFTREMHVQLKNKKLTIIPWDRMIEVLKNQVPLAIRRKAGKKSVEDSFGPVGGFLVHYRMVAVDLGYELERFELEPTRDIPAESIDEALQPTGRFRLELASRDPAETVVTVWVYPDSFAEFRRVKAWMFDEGFLSAARPLPPNVRIGASPSGSRSSAQ
ncbi:MAG: hypothetical protein AAF483_09390 [Planctomycetota bacterium]